MSSKILEYRNRRYQRLVSRLNADEKKLSDGFDKSRDKVYNMDGATRYDASQRLAFGLCKKFGINLPKGSTPQDAWDALKEKTGKSPSDFYSESGNPGSNKVKFNTAGSRKTFTKKLAAAKKSQNPENAWRVSSMSSQEMADWHPNARMHITDGGSTIAIDNGDIVAVCVGPGDGKGGMLRGHDILAYAVKNGGTKLDSYEGNHQFYARNGFEAVSRCQWDSAYEDSAKAQGWNPDRDNREDIIFYKYVGVGNVKNQTLADVRKNIPYSADYDTAYSERDKEVGR